MLRWSEPGTLPRAALSRLPEPLKRPLRRVRAAALRRQARRAAPPPPLLSFGSMHDFLHAQRTVELARMPAGAKVLLSAGCGGLWYFEWLADEYGPVDRHIGVERYLPRPDRLPANVEWVDASVGSMPQVADRSVDLLFSGQNFEHLFGDDLVDFLLECSRVVRPGGHLVIDSPNREIARLLRWTMGEHTIEFTSAEASELVQLAGFDVTGLRGIWLVRDPGSGAVMPFDPYESRASSLEVLRRVQLASRHPEHAFIWWLEARRADRPADAAALRRRHAEIFVDAWPERANRLLSPHGEVRTEGGVRIATAAPGAERLIVGGPFMPLAAGHYEIRFTLRRTSNGPVADDLAVARLEAVVDGEPALVASREVAAAELPEGEWAGVTLAFDMAELRWAGQFLVKGLGGATIEARLAVTVDDRDSPVWPSAARPPAVAARARQGA